MFVSGAGAVWSPLICLEPEPTFFACLEPEPLSVPGPPTSEAAKEKWQLRSNGYRTGILKWISDGKQRMCKKNVTTYHVHCTVLKHVAQIWIIFSIESES